MKNYLHITVQVILFIAVLFSGHHSLAQDWNQIIKANAGDRNAKPTGSRSEEDNYGYSVAISGNYAVVGARSEAEDMNGENTIENAGAAYILQLVEGKWKQVKKLSASKRNQALFGYSVAIHGDYVAVGAQGEWHGNYTHDYHLMSFGAVYIFKKDEGGEGNWGEVKRLEGAQNNGSGGFGTSVAIKDDYLVVGAPNEALNVGTVNEVIWVGAAYVYKRDQGGFGNWGLVKKLVDTDRKKFDQFGKAVAINGDDIAIGTPSDEVKGANNVLIDRAGAVYMFNKYQGGTDNWGQVKKITAPDPGEHNEFGGCIAMSGNDLVIGHNRSATGYGQPESAYVFEKNQGGTSNWGNVKKLVAPISAKWDYFGQSVAINGDYIIIGAIQGDGQNGTQDSGSAYVFKRNQGGSKNWEMMRKILARHPNTGDYFGSAVAISEEYALVGSFMDSDDEFGLNAIEKAGSVTFYQKNKGGTDTWVFVKKCVTEEQTPDDNYGYSVAISGDLAVVGSPYEDQNSFGRNTLPDAGAVYLLHRSAGKWVQLKKLTPLIRGSHDNFGYSVAIKGNYVIVGAPGHNVITGGSALKDAGAAYVFFADQGGAGNWGEVSKLFAANRRANDLFGHSVSMDENIVVVGAPNTGDVSGGQNLGAAYVFEKEQSMGLWNETKMLTAVTRVNNAYFGHSVSVSGTFVVVGAHSDTYNSKGPQVINAGAAYIFKKNQNIRNSWTMVKKLAASVPAYNDRFGYSVAINGEYAIVGAYAESENSQDADSKPYAGSAYIFKKDQGGIENWGQLKKLTATDRATEDLFAVSVSISENYAIVGAYFEDEDALGTNKYDRSGSAYIFKKNLGGNDNWGQDQKITADERHTGDQFGTSVAISETYSIIGSPFDQTDDTDQDVLPGAGSAYIFYNSALPTASFENKLARIAASETESQASLEEHKKIGLYPNPVINRIYVSSEEISKIEAIRMVNAMGRVVASTSKMTGDGLEVGHLAPGIYVVQIQKTDGKVQTDRVVIVR